MWSRILLFLALFLWWTVPAFSWTSRTYQLVVVKSTKLMPKSFQNIFLRHQEELLSGCLRPDDLPESSHTFDISTSSGILQDSILQLSESIPRKIHDHAPFREVARDFGSLAHYIADLNDPMIIGNTDPREEQYTKDFAIYLDKNIDLFPWIFDGHISSVLESGNLNEYIHNIAANTVEKYPRLGEAYFPQGTLVSSDTFDPKSLPFGIASLSWNRSISQTVQLWFYIWRKAHGDTSRTPFFSKQKRSLP